MGVGTRELRPAGNVPELAKRLAQALARVSHGRAQLVELRRVLVVDAAARSLAAGHAAADGRLQPRAVPKVRAPQHRWQDLLALRGAEVSDVRWYDCLACGAKLVAFDTTGQVRAVVDGEPDVILVSMQVYHAEPFCQQWLGPGRAACMPES
jgi:hypothetical protein